MTAPAAEEAPLQVAAAAPRERGQGRVVAALWALGTALGLAIAHQMAPAHRLDLLPAYWLGGAFLVAATFIDVERRRIPNFLTVPTMVAALAVHLPEAVGPALVGLLAPFVLLLPLYATRVMGAGDVKAFMALGALWRAGTALEIALWTLLIVGAAGVVVLALSGELGTFVRRWGRMLGRLLRRDPERGYEAPAAQSAAHWSLPVGAAIGPATVVWLFAGGPL